MGVSSLEVEKDAEDDDDNDVVEVDWVRASDGVLRWEEVEDTEAG